jgi:hypothetical protein
MYFSAVNVPVEQIIDSLSQKDQPTPSSVDDHSSVNDQLTVNNTTNNIDDTKLHAARYHKTENDWDELLRQVGPFANKNRSCSFV